MSKNFLKLFCIKGIIQATTEFTEVHIEDTEKDISLKAMFSVKRIFWTGVLLLFLASCAPRATSPPLFEEKGLAEVIACLSGISRIDTTFSVVFEKADSEIYGDGKLSISGNGDLEMKVYTLGFLALELSSRNGAVKSKPGLDSTKKTILTQGLRDGIFWWDIKDFTVLEEEGFYLLRNADREITLGKKSGLPVKQQIYFPNGKSLTVYYDNPAREEGILYQSKMRMELSRYAVTLTVDSIHFIMQDPRQAGGHRL